MSEISDLHIPFIDFLKKQGLLWRRSRSDKKTSELRGEPDFLIMENGRALAIELKQPKTGKLSTHQVFRHAEYAKAGCKVFVVRELSHAIELVQAWRSVSWHTRSSGPTTDEHLERILGAWWRKTDRGLEKVRNA